MSVEASNFDTELFFIAPIGEEGSPERKRSNNVFVGVVEEAAAKLGMKVGRGPPIEAATDRHGSYGEPSIAAP